MSFSEETKIELTEALPKAQCCRRAFLYGLLCNSDASVPEKVIFDTDIPLIYENAEKLAREFFGKVNPLRDADKRKKYAFEILNVKAYNAVNIIQSAADDIIELLALNKCQQCLPSFLRGVFVSSGSITNPKSSNYHLELSFDGADTAKNIFLLAEKAGISMKSIKRKSKEGLYFKESGSIEDFIAYIGAKRAVFEIMNSKIIKEIRNNENRIANCETNNIEKSVSASGKHIEAIEKLISLERLSVLSPELKETAKLRIEHKDISLAELGAMMNPPISKSGVNHRLNKIIQISKKM